MARSRFKHQTDERLLSGPIEGLGDLYSRYEGPLTGYFYRRTGRADVAADLLGETFARIIESRSRFDQSLGNGRSWIFSIANNVLKWSLENGRVQDETRRALQMQPVALVDADLLRIERASESQATQALAQLPADQADAITGRVLHELPYEELAKRLSCSESVIRKRVSRGLRNLYTQLGDQS